MCPPLSILPAPYVIFTPSFPLIIGHNPAYWHNVGHSLLPPASEPELTLITDCDLQYLVLSSFTGHQSSQQMLVLQGAIVFLYKQKGRLADLNVQSVPHILVMTYCSIGPLFSVGTCKNSGSVHLCNTVPVPPLLIMSILYIGFDLNRPAACPHDNIITLTAYSEEVKPLKLAAAASN